MSSNASLLLNSGRSLFLGLPSMSFCVLLTHLLKTNGLFSLYSETVIYFKSVKLFNNIRSSSFTVHIF